MRVHFLSEADFQRETDDGTNHSRVTAYFHTRPVTITEAQSLNLDAIVAELNTLVDQFTCRGSGFVLSAITKLTGVFVRFRPLDGGSSYIPTPAWLSRKHAVINVKNYHSDCFKWAIISALFPVNKNSDLLSSYAQHENAIDCNGLKFPVEPNQIPLFERNNQSIAVHCLAYDETKKSFSILHMSPEMHKRPHKITLLLLDSPDGKMKHYVWVKSLSRLIASKYSRKCAHYVCLSCLQPFASQRVLDEHVPNCLLHAPQQCAYPSGEKAKMRFDAHHFEFPFDFYLVADLECHLTLPPQPDSTVVSTHVPSGFCVYRVTEHDQFRRPPVTYSGENVMQNFFQHVFDEASAISNILSRNVPMSPLTAVEQAEFDRATTCRNCKADFSSQNPKTRHHSHVTGRYLFPACCNCNLALKPRKCKTNSNTVDHNGYDYLVPIVFHNLSAYDGHFVLQFFRKEYTQYTTRTGKTAYADVGVIPLNGERNLLLRIGNLVFVDSFQFLAASLDNLVKEMRKSGLEDFAHTTRHFGRNELFFKKGCYPYEYMTDATKFDETALPPKSAFYNRLIDDDITDEEYERAQKIWEQLSMRSLRDWHDFYLTLDVLLLTDVVQKFRLTMLNAHGLDCLHFPSLPSMTLQLALKITNVELELISDPNVYLMIESGIRGGLSYVAQRHAMANFPDMPDYRPDLPTSHLLYLDCNSLYSTCQTYRLPVGGFRFLTESELADFDVASVSTDSETGYFVAVSYTHLTLPTIYSV